MTHVSTSWSWNVMKLYPNHLATPQTRLIFYPYNRLKQVSGPYLFWGLSSNVRKWELFWWTDGRTDGRTDGWTNERTYIHIHIVCYIYIHTYIHTERAPDSLWCLRLRPALRADLGSSRMESCVTDIPFSNPFIYISFSHQY